MSVGNITRRGAHSWRIKYEAGERDSGKRQTRYKTIRGTKKQAEAELVRLLGTVNAGAHIDASDQTVAEYMTKWVNGLNHLTPLVKERYTDQIRRTIIPHIGEIPLQRLKPVHVSDWHAALRVKGWGGKPLAIPTIRHAHGLLVSALGRACELELISRNVATSVKLPRDPAPKPKRCLTEDEVRNAMALLKGREIYTPFATALGTGARLGELCALRWKHVDLDNAILTIEGTVTISKSRGKETKVPKTKTSTRQIVMPATLVEILRAHWVRAGYLRLAAGTGRPGPEDCVFPARDGTPKDPIVFTKMWRSALIDLGLPHIRFHDLRHSHASMIIASGMDVVEVSRRLGHANPAITLRIYAHSFRPQAKDTAAAEAVNAIMRR